MKATTEQMSVPAASKQKRNKSNASRFKGTVVSVSAKKTVTVAVDTYKTHPKYRKKYRSTKKYLVHVPEGEYQVGDTVTFMECRPVSKRKRHVILKEN